VILEETLLSHPDRNAIIVADLSYGDAGKGTLVDCLTRLHHSHTVVRFNGGAQAAHNVVAPDGRHHTFAQFGSGMLVAGVHTYLSCYMLLDPYAIFNEEAHLRQLGIRAPLSRTAIDRRALVISPYQQAANRLKELARGPARHGSCGMGIGETRADFLQYGDQVVLAGDMSDQKTVTRKLRFIRDVKRAELDSVFATVRFMDEARADLALFDDATVIEIAADNYAYLAEQAEIVNESYLAERLRQPGTVIFEGAQGVLLDEWYGFHPYTTWSTTTFGNANRLLSDRDYDGRITRLGVFRAYFTRHGAGPFVSEDAVLAAVIPDQHNVTNPWQDVFRIGWFDLVAARYALEVAGELDALAITNLDRWNDVPDWRTCDAYCYSGTAPDLSSFFVHQGRTISRIRVPQSADLTHQAQLTQHLFHCQPRYHSLDSARDGRIRAYLTYLEEALGKPIAIASSGATADDKRAREFWRKRFGVLSLDNRLARHRAHS
jgi:adenylosuccinate synthase